MAITTKQGSERPARTVLLASAGLFAAIFLALGVRYVTEAWLSRPLGQGSFGASSGLPRLSQGKARFRYEHGREFHYVFSVRNDGRMPVKVLGFPASLGEDFYVVIDEVLFDPDGDNRGYVSFEPVTLKPGDELLVRVRAHLANCRGAYADTIEGHSSHPVRYEIAGVTRNQDVPIQPFSIVGPRRADCPEARPK